MDKRLAMQRTYYDRLDKNDLNEIIDAIALRINILIEENSHETWTSPTLQNGWSNYSSSVSTAGYRKDSFGMVHLKGVIKPGTTTAGTTLFALPATHAPSEERWVPAIYYDGVQILGTRIQITTSGNVVIQENSGTINWLSLDAISFET